MRVTITVWGNRISPVFDVAQTILMAEILEQAVVDISYHSIPLMIPSSIAQKIVALKPDTLICGAISSEPAQIIENAGISLLPFITGKAETILQRFVDEQEINSFLMPGCSDDF